MGAWGTGLYQDDVAMDVRDTYKDQLHRGKTGEEITQELMEDYEDLLDDMEDGPVFWFALADTQWTLGRLEDDVKERALSCLENGGDAWRWEMEGAAKVRAREKVLQKLKEKLNTPQPPKKKVSQYRLYQCKWNLGDVYAYPLTGAYAEERGWKGEYLLMRKVGESTWHPGHIVPIVHWKFTKNGTLPQNAAEFDALEYIQTSMALYEERFWPITKEDRDTNLAKKRAAVYETDEFGFLPEYQITVLSTSSAVIPKNLIYVGNFESVTLPPKEFVPYSDLNLPVVSWKEVEKMAIDRYMGHNLRGFEMYHKER